MKRTTDNKLPPIEQDENLKNNPFVNENFKIFTNKGTDANSYTKQLHPDGTAFIDIRLPKTYRFEKAKTTKIYISADNRKSLNLLEQNSKTLLLWIMFELDTNQDYLEIKKDRFMKENDIKSIKTYRKALQDLQINSFICPTYRKDVYYINPKLFFSGNRITKYPQNVHLYKPKKKQKDT